MAVELVNCLLDGLGIEEEISSAVKFVSRVRVQADRDEVLPDDLRLFLFAGFVFNGWLPGSEEFDGLPDSVSTANAH